MANAYFSTTAGSSVAGLDLNNDGISDTVLSNAVVENGTVTVVYGTPSGFDATIVLTALAADEGFALTGTDSGDEFGYVLASANNLTGDNTDALLIGARAAGTVSVVLSGTVVPALTITGLPLLADGMSLTALGDFNGDGIGDFAIGAPNAIAADGLTYPGAVYVIYGSSTLGGTLDVSALDGTNGFVIDGFGDSDFAGTAIAGAGDLNGDGLADLLIGVPGDDDDGLEAGTAYVVYGSTTTAASENINTTGLDVTTFTGASSFDQTGSAVGGGQDVNDDGRADLIIGGPLADPNDPSSGIAYVIFDPDPSATPIDLATLDGTDGFALKGLSEFDQLGAAVQMLGDVSGDGIGDIGILTRSGDLYIVYGTSADTGGVVDLSQLGETGGHAGIVFTNLFPGDSNTQVTLTALGDVNADQSGAINDIGIAATGLNGAPLASINILGGTANFAAMQTAAGSTGGTIDFGAITDEVPFARTDVTIAVGGDIMGTMTEDETGTTGTLTIKDNTSATTPSFASDTANGLLGMFVISSNVWTYTLDPDSITNLQALDADDFVTDRAFLVANNGTQQEVTVTIQGLNDAAVAVGDIALSVGEDIGLTLAEITLVDLDKDDNPSLAGAITQGTYGKIVVDDAGGFTYTITNPAAQAGNTGDAPLVDMITLTADDGSTHVVTVTLTGATEGVSLDFGDNNDVINTSFGNDVINAAGGNDTINPGGGDDVVNAGRGSDAVTDAIGSDTVNGDAGNDAITLLSGNNIANGGADSDYIVTGFQNDTIDGGAGDDVIKAEGDGGFLFGNNQITGGTGDDAMMGGSGIDTFIFNTGDGNDEIGKIIDVTGDGTSGYDAIVSGASFQVGIDSIQLNGFSIATENAVNEALDGTVNAVLVSTIDGLSTVFDAQGTTIRLEGISLASLTESDFDFG